MIRMIKIALVLAVALWGVLGALHNILDWQGTLGAVAAATSMSTIEGGTDRWQATAMPVVVWIGALFIMLSKVVTALCCLWGSIQMWQARQRDAIQFNQAKEMALVGCGVALFMLFTGFVVVAESWFELWRSDAMRAPVLDSAFRYAGMIALVALFVHSKENS